MKKILIGMALCFVFLSMSALAQEAKKPIKIGYINVPTGAAYMSVPAYNGVKLAIEEINAKGGVLGRPLEIISRDSKMDPGEAVRLAEELVSRDKVDVLMNTDSSAASIAVAGWAKQNHMPFVVTASEADSIIWNQENSYVARSNSGGYAWNAAVIKKAMAVHGDKLKNKRWVTIAPSFEFGRSLVGSAKYIATAQGLNPTWVGEQWPVYNKLSAGSTIVALERTNPEVVYAILFGTDVVKFVREAKKRNFIKDRIFVFPTLAIPENIEMLGAEMPKGWVTVGHPFDELRAKKPALDDFMKSYEAAYPDQPIKSYSISGYNGIKLIAAAIEKAGSTDSEKIAAAFDDVQFDASFGEETLRKIDHQATTAYWVGVSDVADGKGKLSDWSEYNMRDNSPPDSYILKIRNKK
ncbi:MAG TPA: ABC transporter substrate-binding protein [Rhodospirillaceae bacterium]|nr:ABC transporter substrate-binding protein [Rhodospirillaceae bacterium]